MTTNQQHLLVIGAASIDTKGRAEGTIQAGTSNPGIIRVSVGGGSGVIGKLHESHTGGEREKRERDEKAARIRHEGSIPSVRLRRGFVRPPSPRPRRMSELSSRAGDMSALRDASLRAAPQGERE